MYVAFYSPEFPEQLARYSQLRNKIKSAKNRVLHDPFYRTERLGKKGQYDLRGLRSVHVGDGQFVIVFAVCEEYLKKFPDTDRVCRACLSSQNPKAVIFLTVGPHDLAYRTVVR